MITNKKSLNELANAGNKFLVITINETTNWSDDIAGKAAKIEGVYLVNLKEPTHCCELAVSYYATFLRNYFHNRDAWDDDKITELEMDNGGQDGMYLSGYSVFNVVKRYRSGTEDDVIEYENGNPSYC